LSETKRTSRSPTIKTEDTKHNVVTPRVYKLFEEQAAHQQMKRFMSERDIRSPKPNKIGLRIKVG
jgi:hypothetical protein